MQLGYGGACDRVVVMRAAQGSHSLLTSIGVDHHALKSRRNDLVIFRE